MELPIQDVANMPELEVKLKDGRAKELERLSVSLSHLERERTQEVEVMFPGSEARRLLLLVSVTGTVSPPRAGVRVPEVRLVDRHVGCLLLTVRRVRGLPRLSGEGRPPIVGDLRKWVTSIVRLYTLHVNLCSTSVLLYYNKFEFS